MENPQNPNQPDLEALAKAEMLFSQFAQSLGQAHKGDFLLVELGTGNFVVGKTYAEANQKAQEQYPHAIFYGGIVGETELPNFDRPLPLSTGDMFDPVLHRRQTITTQDLYDPVVDRPSDS